MIDPHLVYGSRPIRKRRLDRGIWDKMAGLLCGVNDIVLYRCDGVSCNECRCTVLHIDRCPTCGASLSICSSYVNGTRSNRITTIVVGGDCDRRYDEREDII